MNTLEGLLSDIVSDLEFSLNECDDRKKILKNIEKIIFIYDIKTSKVLYEIKHNEKS